MGKVLSSIALGFRREYFNAINSHCNVLTDGEERTPSSAPGFDLGELSGHKPSSSIALPSAWVQKSSPTAPLSPDEPPLRHLDGRIGGVDRRESRRVGGQKEREAG